MFKSYPVLAGLLATVFIGPLLAQQPPPPPGNGGGDNGGGNNDGGNGGGQNLQALRDAPEPDENPITEQKRVLGKILFWDEQLSSDNTVACGTCHKPAAGGADTRLATNPGFDAIFGNADDVVGSPGIRALDEEGLQLNDPLFGHDPQVTGLATPSFFSSMFANSNFWDGRATDEFVDPLDPDNVIIQTGGALESQALGPILSTVEMAQQGRDWNDVVSKLASVQPLALASNIPADMMDALAGDNHYPALFAAAFGDDEITPVRIAMAIASYERTLVPNETPWDLFIEGDASAMTLDQIEGWDLFNEQTPCGNCHQAPLFSDNAFRNIGLRPSAEDIGRSEVSGQNNDRGEFKTPSLRNVGLRGALMHVGWITDVDDALAFYNSGASNTGHTQFAADQDGIPNTNTDIDEINVFVNDPASRAKIVDFISNGLTDPRAAAELFPFDRPTLAGEQVAPTATSFSAISGDTTDDSSTSAIFSGSIVAAGRSLDTLNFDSTDILAITTRIEIAPNDVGEDGKLYCIIQYNSHLYALNLEGEYQPWDGEPDTLPTMERVASLGSVENIPIIDRFSQTPGEFLVWVAYDTNDGVLRYNSQAIQFSVD